MNRPEDESRPDAATARSQPPDGVAFETLIYTDCRPGQGLQGSAGLQFQARSAGADRDAMSVVQRNLLYEPPAGWMRDRRPVEAYPPSFAHIWDGLFATAAGVYLGREANGGREGNQLTHGVVTRDPLAYGPVRPAQLFQAPFWTAEPAPSTDCAPIGPGWSPGPFDAVAAQEFVLGQPHGATLLVTLLSALHRLDGPDGARVLFIADDPSAVLRWITAATLLMPQRRALKIGFKVFTTNPAYAAQPVVAVHPDWDSTSVDVDNDSGYAVFDLIRHEWSELPATSTARRLVRLFCAEDPYDVVDLVEVAAATREPAPEALELSQAMVLPRGQLSLETARLAVDWLRETPAGLLATHRGVLVDQLADLVERWPQDVLLGLDDVARAGQVPKDRVAPVRAALIRSEIERAASDHEVSGVLLPELPDGVWQPEHQRWAERQVVQALGAGLPPAAFDAVLRVAKRFNLPVRLGELRDASHAFVLDWADHPERGYLPSRWPCAAELRDQLEDVLNRRVVQGDGEAVGDDWWDRMASRLTTVDAPLDEAVLAAMMCHSPAEERERAVHEWILGARRLAQPQRALRRIIEVLWRRTRPTAAELRLLGELLGDGVELDRESSERLVGHLADADVPLTAELVGATRELIRGGLLRPPPVVHGLLALDRQLATVCECLPSTPDERTYLGHVELIESAGDRLLRLWCGPLVDALLRIPRPEWVPPVLRLLPEPGYVVYRDRLLAAVTKRADPGYPLTAFYLSYRNPAVPEPDRGTLRVRVEQWSSVAPERNLKQADSRIDQWPDPWPERWSAVKEQGRSRARSWPRWPRPRSEGG
jgi:hypothetical protein